MAPSGKYEEQQIAHLGKAKEMEFHFLPGLGHTYSSQVRALVLRSYWRQSRNDARSADALLGDAGPVPTHYGTAARNVLGATMPAANEDTAEDEDGDAGQLIPTSPLSTQLGQERIDPFETSAMGKTNKLEQLLVDHCTQIIPSTILSSQRRGWLTFKDITVSLEHFGYQRKDAFRPPGHLHWFFLRQDKLTILAVMQFSAANLATLLPQSWRMSVAYYYRALCIHELSERLKTEYRRPSDTILHALIGMIATTKQSRRHFAERTEIDEMAIHAQGLRLALVARGGWKPSEHTHATRHDLSW